MIPKTTRLLQATRETRRGNRRPAGWQRLQAEALREPAGLLASLNLPGEPARAAHAAFPLRAPAGWLSRIVPGDPDDPLLRQILPDAEEMRPQPGFGADPVGDAAARAAPGLLHKYHGRVLLMLTGACAIHCRYCFRRHYPYRDDDLLTQLPTALDYIRGDDSIREVILSGGDPLSLGNRRLEQVFHALQAIPHLRRLRIHSRAPVALPERIDDGLLALLKSLDLQTVMVIHCNHPAELDESVSAALAALRECGLSLLNQSVLLRGVNDDAGILQRLSERLFETGVLAYYLHQLDRVEGAAHFEVPDAEALALHRELRRRLPGYLLPELVRERAGEAAKQPLREIGPAAG